MAELLTPSLGALPARGKSVPWAATDDPYRGPRLTSYDCAEAVNAPSSLDQCFKDLDAYPCAKLEPRDDGTLANLPVSCTE